MIPVLDKGIEQIPKQINSFLKTLNEVGFSGDIHSDYKTRLICATDNSVYQVLPQAVLYPKNNSDIKHIFETGNQPEFKSIKYSPRGGGTGTNGQSLNNGICVDLSKHMNNIIEKNIEQNWVRVQPGVVLDQLNNSLKDDQRFFAPNISTSNRATLGGMISTDACGQGSRIYGKTSDHILELKIMLCNGSEWLIKNINFTELNEIKSKKNILADIYKVVDGIVSEKKELIESVFPKMSRFLTGYNLSKIKSDENFNLNYLLAGSEGTLCLIQEMKLKLTETPKYKHLFALRYASFDDALKDAHTLVEHNPLAIETVDEKIISLAKNDAIWYKVKHMLEGDSEINSINLVEFCGNNIDEYSQKIKSLKASIEKKQSLAHSYYLTENEKDIASLWELRKKGVGLLGNCSGDRRPIPFVEDTAVPPEHLYAYIKDFKALLDSHGLTYGMFGHVDVGCLHVRPALNMKSESDEKLLKTITDSVVKLVKKYGGVLWAEHGKGFRSQYSPEFFGAELYEDLRKIKTVFDPDNRLNPGKIATSLNDNLNITKVDEPPTRGQADRDIHSDYNDMFGPAHFCNGNGACFNYSDDELMCPSYKVTRERIHSPKGRAGMLREWSRQLSLKAFTPPKKKNKELGFDKLLGSIVNTFKRTKHDEQDFSKDVYEVMSECLGCKACATQCPIKVDIPEYRSQFLSLYHERYARPLKDFFIGSVENGIPIQSKIAPLTNAINELAIVRWTTKNLLGLVDTPSLSYPTLKKLLPSSLSINTTDKQPLNNTVILLQDAFTSHYEANLVKDVITLLLKLNIDIKLAPFMPNGKPWHVKGFLNTFTKIASKNAQMIQGFQTQGATIIGIEPSITLTYNDEYQQYLDNCDLKVDLIQTWFSKWLENNKHSIELKQPDKEIILLGHCTEKTSLPDSQKQWVLIFKSFGLTLKTLNTGCCGMAGTYGHETEHYQNSKKLYDMSWGKHINNNPNAIFLATGYSCRSQVKRFEKLNLYHPMQYLSSLIK